MTAVRPDRVRAVSRAEGLASTGDGLRVDTADCAPAEMSRFATMNPFHFDPAWRIPVPGTNHTACSMESVWQGLKLVDGEPDLAMFRRPPTKRPPETQRGPDFDYPASVFRYGTRTVDLVTARLLIYLPAYLYVLDRLVPATVVEEIAAAREVLLYDWDDNHDILDPRSSFSHSGLLAAWFGGRLAEEILPHHRARAGAGEALPLARYHRLHASRRG